MTRALLGAAVAALAVCSAAAAHGGGGALGFRSTVTRVTPSPAGLSIRILDDDDRIDLRNQTGKPLVIVGYQGEPYLAFRNGHVYRNARSPATYLNDDRFGRITLPATADPRAEPAWKQVADREQYEWHDHRIHWMSQTLPPKLRAAEEEPRHVFNWTIPGELGGRRLVIAGSLDYQPPPDSRFRTVLVVPLALLALGGAIVTWLRRRRRR